MTFKKMFLSMLLVVLPLLVGAAFVQEASAQTSNTATPQRPAHMTQWQIERWSFQFMNRIEAAAGPVDPANYSAVRETLVDFHVYYYNYLVPQVTDKNLFVQLFNDKQNQMRVFMQNHLSPAQFAWMDGNGWFSFSAL